MTKRPMVARSSPGEADTSLRDVNAAGQDRSPAVIRRHAAGAYFALTFVLSWTATLCVAFPWLRRGQPLPDLAGILMFPAMLLGPCLAGVLMTWAVDGIAGLRTLQGRLTRWRLGLWYAVLLIPPVLVYGVLVCLRFTVSPAFAPNLFFAGMLFGVPAGYLEEIGWMGFVFEPVRAMRMGGTQEIDHREVPDGTGAFRAVWQSRAALRVLSALGDPRACGSGVVAGSPRSANVCHGVNAWWGARQPLGMLAPCTLSTGVV